MAYRYPYETAAEMAIFYQKAYAAEGLTTSLPTPERLAVLRTTGFKGSDKNFSYGLAIFDALGLKRGARILDFGASWGYHTWQMVRAGFDAVGFEISRPRAEFAKALGVDVKSEAQDLGSGFDLVYSSHVLEHVQNPLETIRFQLSLVREGGMVVAHTPNGSESRRIADPRSFRLNWGFVHPLLLSDRFVAANFHGYPCYVSSDDRPAGIARWDQSRSLIDEASGPGLFFVIVKNSSDAR